MHKLQVFNIIIICSLVLNTLLIFYLDGQCISSETNVIWVDDDYRYPQESDGSIAKPYKYISSAIAAANDGDTIHVFSGIYSGNLVIDKSISLISGDLHTTIINSNAKSAYMIDITTDLVSLEGFTLRDTTNTSHRKAVVHISKDADDALVTDNLIEHSKNGFGINIDGANRTIIRNNALHDTKGIQIQSSNDNYICNNTVGNCTSWAALKLFSSTSNIIENNLFRASLQGIYAQDISDTTIRYNNILENNLYGIAIISGANNIILSNTINDNNIGIKIGSSSSEITENTIFNNDIGISLDKSDCIIRDNAVHNSCVYGIHATSGSYGNTIFNNSFAATSCIYLAKDDGSNQWDNEIIGNYWSDYYGPDNDNDGIGEIAYTRGGVFDRYPKGIFQQPPYIIDSTPAHLTSGTGLRPTLSVKVVDPEDQRMDVYFYYISNSTSHLIDVVHNVKSNGIASIPFYSTVEGKNAVYSYIGQGYDYVCIWYVVVKDQYSSDTSSEWIFSTRQVPFDNERPYVDAGGPYDSTTGKMVSFDGSGCDDSDGDIEFYRWSFGDGSGQSQVVFPQHSYANPGTYTVTLTIIDTGGRSNTATTTVTVSEFNNAPVADIGGPYLINDTSEVTFDASNSLDTDGIIANYTWDFGDGSIGYDSLVVHNYVESGTYTVVLTVVDDNGDSDIASAMITVDFSVPEENLFFTYLIPIIISIVILVIAVVYVILRRRRRE